MKIFEANRKRSTSSQALQAEFEHNESRFRELQSVYAAQEREWQVLCNHFGIKEEGGGLAQ